MTIRYEPVAGMRQVPDGSYLTYAEHVELVRELFSECLARFEQLERDEITADDARKALHVSIRCNMGADVIMPAILGGD